MTDYIEQPAKSYICVPVAIHNAIRWAGNFDIDTESLLKDLISQCKTVTTAGTRKGLKPGTYDNETEINIEKRTEFISSQKIICPTLPSIRKHIQSGGAVILCYKNRKKWYSGHAVFIDQYHKERKLYRVINGPNSTEGNPIGSLTNVEMSKLLNRKGFYYKPKAWFIRRKYDTRTGRKYN